jgi:hypothetical protein
MVLRPPEAVRGTVRLNPSDGAWEQGDGESGAAQEPRTLAAVAARLHHAQSVGRLLGSLSAEGAATGQALDGDPAELAADGGFEEDVDLLDTTIAAIVAAGRDPDGDGPEICRLRQGYDLVTQLAAGDTPVRLRPLALPAPRRSPAAPPAAMSRTLKAPEPPRPGIYRLGGHAVEITSRGLPPRPDQGLQQAEGDPPAGPGFPALLPAGIGDLVVVREHILRYEGGALAHIQNVLESESLQRETRRLDRTEVTVTQEVTTTQETTQDTQTTERFSLDRETSRTVKEDSELKSGLSVSARYGITLEVKADVNSAVSKASEEAAKQAVVFSKDVTERSVSKLTETVRQVRSQTTLSEFEEYHKHGFDNTHGLENISGVYQWVDKVSRAQMYNYGKRMLFDMVVPEPAAFLIATAAGTQGAEPTVPRPFPLVETLKDITENNYAPIAARYHATGIEAPPGPETSVTKALVGDSIEAPYAKASGATLTVPAGYAATKALVSLERVQIPPSEGGSVFGIVHVMVGGVTQSVIGPAEIDLPGLRGQVGCAAMAESVRAYEVVVELVCTRTAEAVEAWQVKTYEAIVTAYTKLRNDYDRAQAEAQAESLGQVQGRNPLENHRLEIEELKKFCLSLITQQQFDKYGALTTDPDPGPDPDNPGPGSGTGYPQVDLGKALAQGAEIRFFEQAFEWEQVQYVLYPYFWGSKAKSWKAKILSSDPDPDFAAFIRAGAARVVVPVRPGFSEYVLYFLQTGKVWGGGPVPPVTEPAYVPIAEEIRAAEEQPGAEIAVPNGSWEVTVPTTLVRLRESGELPQWRQRPDGSWQEVPTDLRSAEGARQPVRARRERRELTNPAERAVTSPAERSERSERSKLPGRE